MYVIHMCQYDAILRILLIGNMVFIPSEANWIQQRNIVLLYYQGITFTYVRLKTSNNARTKWYNESVSMEYQILTRGCCGWFENKPLLFIVYCMCNVYILKSTYKNNARLQTRANYQIDFVWNVDWIRSYSFLILPIRFKWRCF